MDPIKEIIHRQEKSTFRFYNIGNIEIISMTPSDIGIIVNYKVEREFRIPDFSDGLKFKDRKAIYESHIVISQEQFQLKRDWVIKSIIDV